MIPAYTEQVTIKTDIKENPSKRSLEEQVRILQDQMVQMRETVDYINRDRSRLKSEVDQLKSAINRQ